MWYNRKTLFGFVAVIGILAGAQVEAATYKATVVSPNDTASVEDFNGSGQFVGHEQTTEFARAFLYEPSTGLTYLNTINDLASWAIDIKALIIPITVPRNPSIGAAPEIVARRERFFSRR